MLNPELDLPFDCIVRDRAQVTVAALLTCPISLYRIPTPVQDLQHVLAERHWYLSGYTVRRGGHAPPGCGRRLTTPRRRADAV